MSGRSWARDIGLACLSGALLILSFPQFDISPLAWIGLVPLLIVLEGKGLMKAFLLSSVTGIVYFTGSFRWVWTVPAYNLLDYFLLQVLYLPLYVSLWGLGLSWIRRGIGLSPALAAPPLWVTLEYLRAHLSFLSLPLMLLGHSQYSRPFLIQITSVTGVYGLSFLIVLVNGAIADGVRYGWRHCVQPTGCSSNDWRFAVLSSTTTGFLVLAALLYGMFTLSRGHDGERITIALLHGNVSQERKWDRSSWQTHFNRYSELTREARQKAPTVIVWPESAIQGDVLHDPELQARLGRLAKETKVYLLVGHAESGKMTNRAAGRRNYNSMVLFSPEGKLEGDYRKIRLVPFGEYEPLKGIVAWPKAIASAMDDTLAGDHYTLFKVGSSAFGVTICWENIFPEVFGEFVRQGARFMVNASDESWFGGTAARYQFLAVSVFRAAEHRVAIARATNMGVSAFIDPFGRITDRLDSHDAKEPLGNGLLLGELSLSEQRSLYSRYGDVFAFLQITIIVLMLCYAWTGGWTRLLIKTARQPMRGTDYAGHHADHPSSSA